MIPALPSHAGTLIAHVPGWPGYAAGVDGSGWSCKIRGSSGFRDHWRRLAAKKIGKYYGVTFSCGGKATTRYLHRIVLEAFVGPCPSGMEACHDPDPNPANNRLENLRWDTPKANRDDSKALGRLAYGMRHGSAKLKDEDIPEILGLFDGGMLIRRIARRYSVTDGAIRNIVNGRTWVHIPRPAATRPARRTRPRYRGVHWHKSSRRWMVCVCTPDGAKHGGKFRDEVEAARACDRKAAELLGVKAKLNFPAETQPSVSPDPEIARILPGVRT